ELGGDSITARLGQFGGILHLLQGRDVLGDLGVFSSQLVNATLPRPGKLSQLTKIKRAVQYPLQLGEQRQCGLRARRVRDVMRDSRPQCEDVNATPAQDVAEYADDAGRTFIARWREAELLHQLAILGRDRYRDRASVRRVGKQ